MAINSQAEPYRGLLEAITIFHVAQHSSVGVATHASGHTVSGPLDVVAHNPAAKSDTDRYFAECLPNVPPAGPAGALRSGSSTFLQVS